eukprot:2185577-Rhodomonas_salina.1
MPRATSRDLLTRTARADAASVATVTSRTALTILRMHPSAPTETRPASRATRNACSATQMRRRKMMIRMSAPLHLEEPTEDGRASNSESDELPPLDDSGSNTDDYCDGANDTPSIVVKVATAAPRAQAADAAGNKL